MRKYLLMLATVACLSSHAQIAQVNSIEPLLRGVEKEMYYPVLSQDGSKLLFTSVNCQGLKMYDFNDDVTIKISDKERAGLDASFSTDGRVVYFVDQEFKNGKNICQAKKFDISSKQETAISDGGKLVTRPIAVKGGVMTSVDGKMKATTTGYNAVRVQGAKLYITKNGVEKSYSPVEETAGYLWASISPDESKVMFFAAGRGIVVTDLNGQIISELGNYESPVWFGNNHVVAMNAKHNGYQNISSQILIMNVDGTQIQELTKPESMTMNPTASFDTGKIVYNTIDGRLYQMNISLNK